MKKLLVLDGNSVLYRAHYAMPEWRNRSGEATAGVYGFLSMMLKSIEELKPTHLAIVFDMPGGSFRKELYLGYHATRDKDEQLTKDIFGQVDKLRIVFEKMEVPVFGVKGFEADDVIGTICGMVQDKNEVVVVTGDRDLMQLVNKNVSLYMPQKSLSDAALVTREKVKERLGVWPEQVVDYKALAGDSSDNYPGVPGIGPKGAINLLETYGTFEKLFNTTPFPPPTLGGGVGKKLLEGKASGELCKTLATIRTDVPVEFELDKAELPSMEKMTEVFVELGHRSLVRRAGGDESKVNKDQIGLFD